MCSASPQQLDRDTRASARLLTRLRTGHLINNVHFTPLQDRQSERHKDSRLNLRPPSQSATYTTVSAWHHQPEKLILDSCGYEATVSGRLSMVMERNQDHILHLLSLSVLNVTRHWCV